MRVIGPFGCRIRRGGGRCFHRAITRKDRFVGGGGGQALLLYCCTQRRRRVRAAADTPDIGDALELV